MEGFLVLGEGSLSCEGWICHQEEAMQNDAFEMLGVDGCHKQREEK